MSESRLYTINLQVGKVTELWDNLSYMKMKLTLMELADGFADKNPELSRACDLFFEQVRMCDHNVHHLFEDKELLTRLELKEQVND